MYQGWFAVVIKLLIILSPGDLIHQVSQAASSPPEESQDGGSPALQAASPPDVSGSLGRLVAAKAYNLSSELMRILMHSRVLNEEPLILRGTEIEAAGKRADPQSLLCYGHSDAPECHPFSIPRAFNSSLGRASEGVVQLLFQVGTDISPSAVEFTKTTLE